MKHTKYSDLHYSIRILCNGNNTYTVEVPQLPGCYSVGYSKDECIANIVEAIELHLDGLEKIPAQEDIPSIEVVKNSLQTDDCLVSLREACKFLKISDSTMRRYIKDRRISAYRFGKEYKFKLQEIFDFVKSFKIQAKSSRNRKAS
jgi:excisionase family DNA binding protein